MTRFREKKQSQQNGNEEREERGELEFEHLSLDPNVSRPAPSEPRPAPKEPRSAPKRRGNSDREPSERQTPQNTIFAIKAAARRKFNNENHKVVLIKYADKMTVGDIEHICKDVGKPTEIRCHPLPNPKNQFFYGQIEMASFDEASLLIKLLRDGMVAGGNGICMADWAKEEFIQKQPSRKTDRNNRKPPSPEHRVVCCHYTELRDQNQLRNIALRVAQPTGVRALDKPGKSGKYTGFIEMESHALATELMSQIQSDEPGCEASWANEPILKTTESPATRKYKRAVSSWGSKKSITLITPTALSDDDIRETVLTAKYQSKIATIKTATSEVNGSYYHELRFEDWADALAFYQHTFDHPTKGVRLEPAMNKMETATHLSPEETATQLKEGKLIEGVLRISNANYNHAFVSDPEGGTNDFLINGRHMQNRALHGDRVAIRVLDEAEWVENRHGARQRCAEVVAILSSKSIKRCAGCFSTTELGGLQACNLLFLPMDSRLPRLLIAKKDLSAEMLKQVSESATKKIIYQVEIIDWEEGALNAHARLVDRIGDPADLSNLIAATLINYDVDTTDLDTLDLVDELPGADWKMPPAEIARRRDFRNECVFSIDPATARDLDDALHIKKLPKKNTYEVGVHIADVAYFVPEGGKIDKEASARCTSTYMPDRVVSMLPRRLCEDLCSLNPDVERFSFSVVFEMDLEGNVIGTPWYGRGVIVSAAKLSYEHAQYFLDNRTGEIDSEQFPPISCGFTLVDIRTAVLNLNTIALNLRKRRYNNGSIRIDQTKIGFTWDAETKTPNGFFPYIRKDSHKLIEEFMLFANVAVAEKIENDYPELAFLRCHPEPTAENCQTLKDTMEAHDIVMDTTNSKTLASSIQRIVQENTKKYPNLKVPFESALSIFSVKIMQLAKYFCAGKQEYRRHYALAMPLYTHFTSPIRRYADLVVHRQLAAAIGAEPLSELTPEELKEQADGCNERKIQAKLAGEEGSQIYFWSMVKMITRDSAFIMDGVITDLVEHGVEVLLYETGTNVRCYFGEMGILKYQTRQGSTDKIIKSVELSWAADRKPLGRDSNTNTPNKERPGECKGVKHYKLFMTVKVSVTPHNDPGKLIGELLMPEEFN